VVDTERPALLIIRGWRQPDGAAVVRMIRVDGLLGGRAVSTVTSDRDELIHEVGSWFDTFCRR
jgi:hypothetical protein